MEKYEKYNSDEETIEAWLKGFEIRLLCHNITAADRKRNWCQALVGDTGNSVIERLPQAATWVEIKEELCSVLGDGEPGKRAFKILSQYKPKGKGLGEMATDIMAKAAIATNDADLQTQMGLKVFLKNVPESIGHELRRKHFGSVREALAEARFLPFMKEDEDRDNGKVFTVKEEVKPVEEPKVDLNQVVEACMRQLQALQASKKQSERPRSAKKRLRCWCCKEMGHLMRACPVVQQIKAAYCKQKAEKQRVPEGARWCQRVPDDAKGCQRVPDGTRECQRVPDGTRGYQMVTEGTRGCQMVPEIARGCQRDQVGTAVAPGLGKASDLIFVTVSIAGVEVVALVYTGATTACCRWEWHQKWKDHLGAVIKSKVRIIGVGPDPIKIKGLPRPLTLHWDGVGGKFQLMILTALTDVDVVLGMDVLSQFDVKIDFKKQVASPAREACTPLERAKTVGLLRDDPGFTFKGKILVKEEGVEEVAKGVLRQDHWEVHRVWMASEIKMKTKDKGEDRKIVRESSMPWDKAGYKAQLQRDLKDIQHKLSRVLGQDLTKSDSSFVEATSPVKCIEGGVLVDLCMQRSGKRGSGCDAPNEADKFPRSADGSFEASKGFPTPVTSPLRPPKPPRTEVKQYSWHNSTRKEVCMHIRILKPLKTRRRKKVIGRMGKLQLLIQTTRKL